MTDTLPEAKVLPEGPNDGVSALRYLPSSSFLASTSWDGRVRVHDTAAAAGKVNVSMDSGPLLSLAVDAGGVWTGGMDGSVRRLDLEASTPLRIGQHAGEDTAVACSCLSYVDELSLVASAGWNRQLYLWDARQSTPAATLALPGKAFGMDAHGSRLVVATSGRRIGIVDVRKAAESVDVDMVLDRESSLKYQTRTVRFFPTGDGLAVGSIEGRVAIEYLEELNVPPKGKKYAFKCHRVGDRVYPVNCIEFHPHFGTFATGGADGTVVLWDGLNKKKLVSLPAFPTSIAALAFKDDGSELAIASSYTFEEGEREHPHDEIYVRPMLESECQPKGK